MELHDDFPGIGAGSDITGEQDDREKLRYLAQRLVSIQEAERWKISRKLHDEAGQSLTALMINLDMLRVDLPPQNMGLHDRIDACVELVHETIDLIRTLAQELRPPALDTLGLNLTLEGYCLEFTSRTHVPVEYQGLETTALSDETNITIYRFLQEGLNLIAQHAQGQVSVSLEESDGGLTLTIQTGAPGEAIPTQASATSGPLEPFNLDQPGLVGIQERFNLFGGSVEVRDMAGRGIALFGRLPMRILSIAERELLND
jgi:signal transduction histidine kinase